VRVFVGSEEGKTRDENVFEGRTVICRRYISLTLKSLTLQLIKRAIYALGNCLMGVKYFIFLRHCCRNALFKLLI
jgi:hypothetical protein